MCFYATQLIKRKLVIDDSLDVFPVHGVGGILGTMLAGVFASTSIGAFSGHGFADGIETMGAQVWSQFVGVITTIVFTAVMTYIIIKVTGWITGGIRVDKDEETQGLDLVLHDEAGYKL